MKKYIVKLSREERTDLHHLIAQGQASARKLAHARILLKADSGQAGRWWRTCRATAHGARRLRRRG